jgi:hypothetical protein
MFQFISNDLVNPAKKWLTKSLVFIQKLVNPEN